MIVAYLLHEATALWNVSYAVQRHAVTPIEQHVPGFLEMIPLMAGAFVAVLHWPQLLALFGPSSEAARFDLALKQGPLPVSYASLSRGTRPRFTPPMFREAGSFESRARHNKPSPTELSFFSAVGP